MMKQRAKWWRMFADTFIIKTSTPLTIVDGICELLVPCHEDWAWHHQPLHNNDNGRR